METITFHCKVITPMFLAGADGQTPELRAPSIKGGMRFWWRALSEMLGYPVDLVNTEGLSPFTAPYIESEKRLAYEKGGGSLIN